MKILLILTALSVSLSGFGQSDEFLIKNNGDTIKGEVKLVDKDFYVDIDEYQTKVNADDVLKVNSKNFKGSIVVHCVLQTYVENLSELELDYIERGERDTIMILDEIYSTEKMNLYYGVNDFKVPFYFYKTPKDPKPVQLVVRYYLQGGLTNYNNNRSRYRAERSLVNIAEDKGYVNQLWAIMGHCKNITEPMWELLSYRDYSLKQIIKKYNKCK